MHISLKSKLGIRISMVSKEIFSKILERKIRKYPKWLQDGLREDLMADFEKFNESIDSEVYGF